MSSNRIDAIFKQKKNRIISSNASAKEKGMLNECDHYGETYRINDKSLEGYLNTRRESKSRIRSIHKSSKRTQLQEPIFEIKKDKKKAKKSRSSKKRQTNRSKHNHEDRPKDQSEQTPKKKPNPSYEDHLEDSAGKSTKSSNLKSPIRFNKNISYEITKEEIYNESSRRLNNNLPSIRSSLEDYRPTVSSKTKSILNKILSTKKQDNTPIGKYFKRANDLSPLLESSNNSMKAESSKPLKNEEEQEAPPILSESTKKLLDKINKDKLRKNKFNDHTNQTASDREKTRSRSKSAFSLMFKYEDYLNQNGKHLILPPSYKSLSIKFEELEQTINYFKLINKPLVFSDIVDSIEKTYKRKFTLENFQQILYVVPHFYIYKWEKLSSRSYLLFVDIPRNFKEMLTMEVTGSTDFRRLQSAYDPAERSLQEKDLQDRKEYFRNILINITNDYHQSFLERNSIQFDALASRTWHSNFDLIKHVEEIPIFELQGHQEVHVQTISDILNDNDYKTPLFRLALEEVDVCNDRKDSSQLPSKEFASKLPVGFERKAKEIASRQAREIRQYALLVNKKAKLKKDYVSLCECLHHLFIYDRKQSISLDRVISKALEDEALKTYSYEVLKAMVFRLIEHFPLWLEVFEHSKLGTLLMMSSNSGEILKTIVNQLKDKIDKGEIKI